MCHLSCVSEIYSLTTDAVAPKKSCQFLPVAQLENYFFSFLFFMFQAYIQLLSPVLGSNPVPPFTFLQEKGLLFL